MRQTRTQSFAEAIVNTIAGFIVTFTFSPLIYHISGIQASVKELTLSVVFFTFLSVIRGYILRRCFNNLEGLKMFFVKILTKCRK